MKVLSLTQPYASLVCLGAKTVETRSWRTSYRGPLLIHASKSYPKAYRELENEEPFRSALRPRGNYCYPSVACGCIIGTVILIACISVHDPEANSLPETEREFGNFGDGRFLFILKSPKFLPKPIPAKGHLGLWEYEGL